MDTLEGMEASIQKVVLNAFRPLIGEAVEVLFFDVTTLYFESTREDELEVAIPKTKKLTRHK